jgi:splicing factor 3A subunit 1
MSVQEVESMTLAQKRMAAMIMESTAEDVEAHRAQQAAAEAEAAAAVGGVGVSNMTEDDAAMEQSDDEDAETLDRKRKEEEERRKEIERAQALKASSVNTAGPMKIRTDYVPKREYRCIIISCPDEPS